MISSKVLPFNRDGGGPGTVVDAGAGEAPVAGAAVEVEAPAVAAAGVADVPAVALHKESATDISNVIQKSRLTSGLSRLLRLFRGEGGENISSSRLGISSRWCLFSFLRFLFFVFVFRRVGRCRLREGAERSATKKRSWSSS